MVKKVLAAYQERPDKVSFESQEDDEDIILLLRQHWVTNVGWLFFLLLMLSAPLLFVFANPENTFLNPDAALMLGIIWYLIALGYGIESFLHWYFNVYIVTDRRIVDVDFYGILHKEISETTLDQVQDVTYTVYGLAATVFDYGDVLIQTAAEEARFDFLNVAHPGIVHDKLTDIVSEGNN